MSEWSDLIANLKPSVPPTGYKTLSALADELGISRLRTRRLLEAAGLESGLFTIGGKQQRCYWLKEGACFPKTKNRQSTSR